MNSINESRFFASGCQKPFSMLARLRGVAGGQRTRQHANFKDIELDDKHCDQPANVVRVVVHRARGLRIMDKSIASRDGGSSDPFVVLSLNGERQKSSVKKKQTSPTWQEAFELAAEELDTFLEVTVYDYDVFSSPDFMGALRFALKDLSDRNLHRGWYKLLDKDLHEPSQSRGELEVSVRWVHEPERVIALPAVLLAPEEHPNKLPPNALRAVVIRASRLPIMDLNALSRDGCGTTDPYVKLTLHTHVRKTTVKTKQLNPIWLETFVLPADDLDLPLKIDVFDNDLVGSDDLIGKVSVDLRTLQDRKPHRAWYAISSSTRNNAQKAKLELGLRLYHDPAFELRLPADMLDVPAHRNKPANELRVIVVRARALPSMDKNLFSTGGSSDPFARLEYRGVERSTAVKKRCLDPVWLELVTFPIDDGHFDENESIQLSIFDFDVLSSPDLMGSALVSLKGLADRKPRRLWHKLQLPPGMARAEDATKVTPKIEVALRLVHNPASEIELVPGALDDKHPDRFVNELRIVVIRARALPPADSGKNMFGGGKGLGLADPFVLLAYGDDETRTGFREKTLDPVWNETRVMPVEDGGGGILRATVRDQDAAGQSQLMGHVDVSTSTLYDRKIHRAWFSLSTSGKVELALRLVHNPASVVELPDFMDVAAHPDKPANELCIYIARLRCTFFGRSKFAKQAQALVRVGFFDQNETSETRCIHVEKEEMFNDLLSFDANEVTITDASLDVAIARRDKQTPKFENSSATENPTVSSTLATTKLQLATLVDRTPMRQWVQFFDSDGHTVLAKAEIVLRWIHNPARHIDLPRSIAMRAIIPDKPANEVYVVLIRASRLDLSDRDNATATIRFGGDSKSSKPFARTATEWMEEAAFALDQFDLRCEGGSDDKTRRRYKKNVEVTILSEATDELLGRILLSLADMRPIGKSQRTWRKLSNSPIQGSAVEVYTLLAHNIERAHQEEARRLKKLERLEIKAAEVSAEQRLVVFEESADAVKTYERRLAMFEQMYSTRRSPNDVEVVVVRGSRLTAGMRYELAKVKESIPDSYVSISLIGPHTSTLTKLGGNQKARRVALSSKRRTRTISQERVPTWIEKFTFELPEGATLEACAIAIEAHDAAAVRCDMATGSAIVELRDVSETQEREERRAWRGWSTLSNMAGKIDMWMRLVYNPDRVPDIALAEEVECFPDLPVNELRVVLVAARVRADEAALATHGSPGLQATLEFAGRLRPVSYMAPWDTSGGKHVLLAKTGSRFAYWRERIDFVVTDKSLRHDSLRVSLRFEPPSGVPQRDVFDLGSCRVPYISDGIALRSARRGWYQVRRSDDETEVIAEVEIVTRLTHNAALESKLPARKKAVDQASCTATDSPPWTACTTDVRNLEGDMAHDTTSEAVPRWFFLQSGEECARGPHNIAALRRLWEKGFVGNETLVWRTGMDDWRPIDRLAALKRILWNYPEVPTVYEPDPDSKSRVWFYIDGHKLPPAQAPGLAPAMPLSAAHQSDGARGFSADSALELDSEHASPQALSEEIVDADAAFGPFTEGEMRDAAEGNRLAEPTLVWRGNENKWKQFGSVFSSATKRADCVARRLIEPSPRLTCELCGGLATLHSMDALQLQLREGDCADFAERPLRPLRPSVTPSIGSTASAVEIADGTMWVGVDDSGELQATHIVRVVNAKCEDEPPSFVHPDLSEEYAARHGDYDGKVGERRVIQTSDVSCQHHAVIESELAASEREAAAASVMAVPPVLVEVELRESSELCRAQEVVWNAIWDFVERRWERPEKREPRILIYDEQSPPMRGLAIAAACMARRDGLTGGEILAALDDTLPESPEWRSAIASAADSTAIGRLFCEACFEEWKIGKVDDALSTRLDAAVSRLRARDPNLLTLDLRDEGPLSPDDAGLLGAASCRVTTLLSLDISGCGLGDLGCSAFTAALTHGSGVGGGQLALCLSHNSIKDAGAAALATMLSVGTNNRDRTVSDHQDSAPFDEVEARLTSLDVSHNKIRGNGGTRLARALRRNSTLISLNLAHNELGDVGGEAICLALNVPDAEAVLATKALEYRRRILPQINGDSAQVEAADDIATSVSFYNTTLTRLNVASNSLGASTAVALAQMFERNHVLTSVNLAANSKLFRDAFEMWTQGSDDKKPQTPVGKSQRHTSFEVENCGWRKSIISTTSMPLNIKQQRVEMFTTLRISKTRGLRVVCLANSALHGRVLKQIARWLGSTSCACCSLDLSNIEMHSERCAAFADAVAATGGIWAPLEKLELSGNPLGTYGAARMVAALALGLRLAPNEAKFSPTVLGLAQCALSPAAGVALFALFDGRLDVVIDALDNALETDADEDSADDDTKLSAMSRLRKLVEKKRLARRALEKQDEDDTVFWPIVDLDLSDNNLGPIAAKALTRALHFRVLDDRPCRLTRLFLANACLSIAGAEALAPALSSKTLPHLSHLDLATNAIRDAGCRPIVCALPILPRLTFLNLSFNDLTHLTTIAIQQVLQTTSKANDEYKLFNLTVDMEGNDLGDVKDGGTHATAPCLARSKLNFSFSPVDQTPRGLVAPQF